MNVKEYSIIPDTDTNSNRSKCDDDFIIYNMKLTDELMEKLTRGQVDLNNLQEIDFIHTEKGVDVSAIIVVKMVLIILTSLCLVVEDWNGNFSFHESERNSTDPFTFQLFRILVQIASGRPGHAQTQSEIGIGSWEG